MALLIKGWSAMVSNMAEAQVCGEGSWEAGGVGASGCGITLVLGYRGRLQGVLSGKGSQGAVQFSLIEHNLMAKCSSRGGRAGAEACGSELPVEHSGGRGRQRESKCFQRYKAGHREGDTLLSRLAYAKMTLGLFCALGIPTLKFNTYSLQRTRQQQEHALKTKHSGVVQRSFVNALRRVFPFDGLRLIDFGLDLFRQRKASVPDGDITLGFWGKRSMPQSTPTKFKPDITTHSKLLDGTREMSAN